MKRAFASVAGLVGIAALGRWFSQRRHPAAPPAEPQELPAGDPTETATGPAEDDPAEELRRKLADTRGSATTTEAEPNEETIEERRARVHAKAREAIDAMAEDGGA